MINDMTAIDRCIQCHLMHILQYKRGNGRHCAEITVTDPFTGACILKTVSSIEPEKLAQKMQVVMRSMYLLIRDNVLRSQFMANTLTLKNYLDLDLPYLAEGWPSTYGAKEYAALVQYAELLTKDLNACVSIDDYLPVFSELGLGRQTELIVLRMLRDIVDKLIQLKVYDHVNPITEYYRQAQAAYARQKEGDRGGSQQALSDDVLHMMYADYKQNYLNDARYLAIYLRVLNLSAAQIAAMNIGDLVEHNGMLAIPTINQMVKAGERYQRTTVSNEWASRLLPLNWLRHDIEQWIMMYKAMGIDNLEKVPLCAFGCRKNPKRCTPTEIERFLQGVIDCHACPPAPELIPNASGKGPPYRQITHKLSPSALYTAFTVAGCDDLKKYPFEARYLTGKPPETVDETVYLDFTAQKMQYAMDKMISRIFQKMKLLDGDNNEKDDNRLG